MEYDSHDGQYLDKDGNLVALTYGANQILVKKSLFTVPEAKWASHFVDCAGGKAGIYKWRNGMSVRICPMWSILFG